MDMLEPIIQLVTMLFLLSMVCERIADFLKHFLNQSTKLKIGDTLTKFPTEDVLEDARYYRILKMNISCGIITAAILKADLIKILNKVENSGETLGWNNLTQNYEGWDYFFLPFGLILTGCFISFGSKFWHDLLDILLEIKNAKRSLTQINNQQSSELTPSFEQLSGEKQLNLINDAIALNKHRWYNEISNINGICVARKELQQQNKTTSNLSIQISVSDKKPLADVVNSVPPFIEFGGFKIPTDVIQQKPSKPFDEWAYLGNEDGPVRKPGGTISRVNEKNTGTLGLKVIKNEADGSTGFYFLSCFHVLFNENLLQRKNELLQNRIIETEQAVDIPLDDIRSPGKLTGVNEFRVIADSFSGKLSFEMDAAIARLRTEDDVDTDVHGLGQPTNIYTPTESDINLLRVNISGARSGVKKNILLNGINADTGMDYFNDQNNLLQMQGLLRMEKAADSGDSGAPVMDKQNRILGIVVGGNDDYTYAIPIQRIIKQLKIFPVLKN